MNEPENEEEKFSDNPQEQLQIENEILKLKLNAELGGRFESLADIPAEIENLFLKNVIAFEHEHAKAAVKTVYDVLGRPAYKAASGLTNEQVQQELASIEKLLEKSAIVVDYLVEYPPKTKYTFITEELFKHESSMFSMPGMTTHYIYEEFHPNHEYEIRQKIKWFSKSWFKHDFSNLGCEIAEQLTTPANQIISRDDVVAKMQMVFDSFTSFARARCKIKTVSFEIIDDNSGIGYAEGSASYDAIMETQEVIRIKGKFRFDFTMGDNYWQIAGISWPGFNW